MAGVAPLLHKWKYANSFPYAHASDSMTFTSVTSAINDRRQDCATIEFSVDSFSFFVDFFAILHFYVNYILLLI